MNYRLPALCSAASLLLLAAPAQADDDFWVGAKAGTLGLGLEATWRPVPYLDVRGGFNAFSYDDTRSESGVEYDAELDLSTFYATANLRVPLSPFRATVGIFSNGNEINLQSNDAQQFTIGDQTFNASDVGTLNGNVTFDSVAPYAGVGLDFRMFDTVGLHIDAGVLFQGEPQLALVADGLLATDPTFQAELEQERADVQSELEDFEYYPVVSIGLSVNF
ncbi:MAG: hypothetical protein AB8G16_12560 [Gammaproteobacteria bacterium]